MVLYNVVRLEVWKNELESRKNYDFHHKLLIFTVYLLYKRTSGNQIFEDGTTISVIPPFISGRHIRYSSFQLNVNMAEVVKYCSRALSSINCISVKKNVTSTAFYPMKIMSNGNFLTEKTPEIRRNDKLVPTGSVYRTFLGAISLRPDHTVVLRPFIRHIINTLRRWFPIFENSQNHQITRSVGSRGQKRWYASGHNGKYSSEGTSDGFTSKSFFPTSSSNEHPFPVVVPL